MDDKDRLIKAPEGRALAVMSLGVSPTSGKPVFQAETGEERRAQHWAPSAASGKARRGDCQPAGWPPSP